MYLDGGWSGGEGGDLKGSGCLVAYSRGGGVEEINTENRQHPL